MIIRQRSLLIGLTLILVILAAISLSAGRIWIPAEVWWNHLFSNTAYDPRWAIISELRLPRTLLGIIIGGALGLMGAAMQGYTRNPLADPAILGISAMAAFGAVMSLYLGLVIQNNWTLPVMAMLGAIIGVILLLALSGLTSGVITFILAGIILNTVATAGVSLALNLAPNPWAVSQIVNWLMGSLADRSFDDLYTASPFIIIGCLMLLSTGKALDALTFGELGARSLGINLKSTRWILAIGVGLATGAGVAVTGVIGFIGLITPHLMRPFVGARPSRLLPASALAGACVTLAADILVRLIPSVVEIKLGVAMAILGGPFFLALLIAMRRRLT
ncbi:iron ABC transporter permease [Microvirga sp. W0021]|uniref:Iron ABC transporter permease n=1 Tax=Hohaiivirga grylli TaxID=3133970 RepID=A0ABV0BJZ5_9HYPH